MGNSGALLFYREKNRLIKIHKKAEKFNSINFVGCGDIFGAIFFYFYICTQNKNLALTKAVKGSGFVTTLKEFKEYEGLKNAIE